MIRNTRFRFVLLTLPLLIFLLGACGYPLTATGSASPGASPPPTPGAQTGLLPVLPTLQKSLQVTGQLKTVHVAVTGKGTIAASGPWLPGFAQPTPYSFSAAADITLVGQAGKAKAVLKLMPAQGGPRSFKGAARLVGSELYLEAPSHRWFSLNLAAVAAFFKAHVALPQPQATLALAQLMMVRDAGSTLAGGHPLRHITLSIDPSAWGQLATGVQQQQARQILASLRLTRTLAIDLFIDPATFHLVRLHIRGGIQVNVDGVLASSGEAGMPGKPPRTLSVTFDLTLTLSRFNQPVAQVTAPAQATPIDLVHLLVLP